MRAVSHGVVVEDAELEAAAAKIGNETGLSFGAERGKHRFPAEARFFFGANDFQLNTGRFFDAADEGVAILGFAGRAGGDCTIFGDAVLFHDFVQTAEDLDTFLEDFLAEAMTDEDTFAETERAAFGDQRLDIERGVSAGYRQADGIGAGVDGGDMNGLRHWARYRQRWARAEEGEYLEARMPRCSPIR